MGLYVTPEERRAMRRRVARDWAHARTVLRVAQQEGQYGIAATFREVLRALAGERAAAARGRWVVTGPGLVEYVAAADPREAVAEVARVWRVNAALLCVERA